MAKEADSYHCVVSVLGYVAHGKVYRSSSNGTGKSALCCRFTHPALDDYIDDHPTLLALHEFESMVVSTDSFLYWGPKEVELACGNSRQGRRSAKVRMEVVEHTLFYHDETSKIFKQLEDLKLHDVDKYAKRAVLAPESSRKTSYYSRDCIGFPDRYECLPYPSNVNRIARGFIIACDVSVKMPQFEAHMVATEQIAHRLFKDSKHPFIVVATKRDMAEPISLQKLHDWASKKRITLIETSAKENINIKSTFSCIATKIFKSAKLTTPFMSYSDAIGASLTETTKLKTSFKMFLKKKVTSSAAQLSAIEDCQEYIMAVEILGKFGADEIYARNLLEVRNHEIRGFPGVMENPDLRMEILEQFVDEITMELIAHKRILRSMINTLVSPRDDFYMNEGRSSAGSSPTKKLSIDKAPLLPPEDIYDEVDDLPFVHKNANESNRVPMVQNVDDQYDNFDNFTTSLKPVSADSSPVFSARTNTKPLSTLDRSSLLKRQLPSSASSSPITPRSAMFQQDIGSGGLSQELQKMLTKQVDSRSTSRGEALEDIRRYQGHQNDYVPPTLQTRLVESELSEDNYEICDRYGFLQAPDKNKMSSIVSKSPEESTGTPSSGIDGTRLKMSPTPPPPPKRLYKKDGQVLDESGPPRELRSSNSSLSSLSSSSSPLVVTKELPRLPQDLQEEINSFGQLPPLPNKVTPASPLIPTRLRKVTTPPFLQAEERASQDYRSPPVSMSLLGPQSLSSDIYQNRGGVAQQNKLPKPKTRPKSPRASKSPPPLPPKEVVSTSSDPQPHNVSPPHLPIGIRDNSKSQSKDNSQKTQLPDKEFQRNTSPTNTLDKPDPVPKTKPKPKNYKMVTLNERISGPPKPPPKPSNYPSVTIKTKGAPAVIQEDEETYVSSSTEDPPTSNPSDTPPTDTVPPLPTLKPKMSSYETTKLRLKGKSFQEEADEEGPEQGEDDFDIYVSSSADPNEVAATIATQQSLASQDPPTEGNIRHLSNYEKAKLQSQGNEKSPPSVQTGYSQDETSLENVEQDEDDTIYTSSSTGPEEDLKATTTQVAGSLPAKPGPPVVQNKPSSYELAKLKKQAKERSATVTTPGPVKLPQYEPTAPKLDTTKKTVSADSVEYKPKLEALRKRIEDNKKKDNQPAGLPPPSYPAPPLPMTGSPSVGRRLNTSFDSQMSENDQIGVRGRMAQSKSMEMNTTTPIGSNQRKNYAIHTLPKQSTLPSPVPPPLPPRTEDMKEFSSSEDIRDAPLLSPPHIPEVTNNRARSRTVMDHPSTSPNFSQTTSTPPKARKNYFDIVKRVFTTSKDRDEGEGNEESVPPSTNAPRPPQFIRMRGRPLPAAPNPHLFDAQDPTADYEPIDEFSLSQFQHKSPSHQANVLPTIVPPDPSILDNPEQMRAFITRLMTMNQTQQPGVFQYPETSLRPQLIPSPSRNKPKRSQSVNYPHQIHSFDNTDTDGYEITDEWIPPRGFVPPTASHDNLEYHYPALRGFKPGRRVVPPRSSSISPRKSPILPARSPTLDDNDGEEYINMYREGGTEDYDYENFEIVNSLRSGGSSNSPNVSPSKKLSRRNSMDDMHIYYNMRQRDFPLDVSPSTLPPRKAKGYEEPIMKNSLSSLALDVDEETGQKLSQKEEVSPKKVSRPLPPRNKPRVNVNYGQSDY